MSTKNVSHDLQSDEVIAWVRAHGSERLKAALDVGLLGACAPSYRTERLASEYPGWAAKIPGVPDSECDAVEPSLSELHAFSEVRKTVPDAVMVMIEAPERDDMIHVAKVAALPGVGSGPFWRVLA
jgi:hypothetical protein